MRNRSISGPGASSVDRVSERDARPVKASKPGRVVHTAVQGDTNASLVLKYFSEQLERIPLPQLAASLQHWLERDGQLPTGGHIERLVLKAEPLILELPTGRELHNTWDELRRTGGLPDALSDGSSTLRAAPNRTERGPANPSAGIAPPSARAVGAARQKVATRAAPTAALKYQPRTYKVGPKVLHLGETQARLVSNASFDKLKVSTEHIPIKDPMLAAWLTADELKDGEPVKYSGPSRNIENTDRAHLTRYLVEYVEANTPPSNPIAAFFVRLGEILRELFTGELIHDNLRSFRELGIRSVEDLRSLSVTQAAYLAQQITADAITYFHDMIERGPDGELLPRARELANLIDTMGVAELLGGGRGVCRNYAEATAAVFDALRHLQNDPTPLVNAHMRTVSSDNHAWNVLAVTQAGGQVVMTQLDPTWADVESDGAVSKRDFSFQGAGATYAPEGDRTYWLEANLIVGLDLRKNLMSGFTARLLGESKPRVTMDALTAVGGPEAAYAALDEMPMAIRHRCFNLLDAKVQEAVLDWAKKNSAPTGFLFAPNEGEPREILASSPRGRSTKGGPIERFTRFAKKHARLANTEQGRVRLVNQALRRSPTLLRELATLRNSDTKLQMALFQAGVKHPVLVAKEINDRVQAWVGSNRTDPVAVELWNTAQQEGALTSPMAFATALLQRRGNQPRVFRAAWIEAGGGDALAKKLTEMFAARGLEPAEGYARCAVAAASVWAPKDQSNAYMSNRAQLLHHQIKERGEVTPGLGSLAVEVGVAAAAAAPALWLKPELVEVLSPVFNLDWSGAVLRVPEEIAARSSPKPPAGLGGPPLEPQHLEDALRVHQGLFAAGSARDAVGKALWRMKLARPSISVAQLATLDPKVVEEVTQRVFGDGASRVRDALMQGCAEIFLRDVRAAAQELHEEAILCIDELLAEPAQLQRFCEQLNGLPQEQQQAVKETLKLGDGPYSSEQLRASLPAVRESLAKRRFPSNVKIMESAPAAVALVQQRWGINLAQLENRKPPAAVIKGLEHFHGHALAGHLLFTMVSAFAMGWVAGASGLAQGAAGQFLLGFGQNMAPIVLSRTAQALEN